MVQFKRMTIWAVHAMLWTSAVIVQLPSVFVSDCFASSAGMGPDEMGVIVNDLDPLSKKIAGYYRARRGIPASNVIHVKFTPNRPAMTRAEFLRIKQSVDRQVAARVQALTLTWLAPYRVECMSITTAFAAGFDEAYCSKSCGPTRADPYFNSNSREPYNDYHLRPAMILAGKTFEDARKLIERGIASDGTFPAGTAYLLSTNDRGRNARAVLYPEVTEDLGAVLDVRVVKADFIENKKNVLFYFTGIPYVKSLETINFLPGAIADHLTSAGGRLIDSDQMSSLRWLEAGATGSYGTVVEPCNYLEKFPRPDVVMSRYLHGETLIEAYWKSVAWPGQGVFIGEPLASPFSSKHNVRHVQ